MFSAHPPVIQPLVVTSVHLIGGSYQPDPHQCGRLDRYCTDAAHRSSVENEMSVLDSVRNVQRRASQQALIHSDFTLILLTLVQAAAASPCGSTRLTRLCRAPAPTMVSNTQHLQLCQEVNK